MTNVQQVPALTDRPETGAMQFGDDWPGVFIRGDNALFFAMSLAQAIERMPADQWMGKAQLINLMKTLRSCSVGNTGWPPKITSEAEQQDKVAIVPPSEQIEGPPA